MSAKVDRETRYVAEAPEFSDIVCEQCGTMITQTFAQIEHHDEHGAYSKFRGFCEKCDKEMWSAKLR